MRITFSALGDEPSKQVADQGMKLRNPERIDRYHHAITLLHVHGLLTDGESDRARRRLVKEIAGDICRERATSEKDET